MSRLEFDTGPLPAALIARPLGDIDMAVTPRLQSDLLAAAESHGAGCLVVDLGAVDYIDSSGIELLFRLHGGLTADDVDLIVVAPAGSAAARLLGLVALADIGDVRDSLDTCGGREPR